MTPYLEKILAQIEQDPYFEWSEFDLHLLSLYVAQAENGYNLSLSHRKVGGTDVVRIDVARADNQTDNYTIMLFTQDGKVRLLITITHYERDKNSAWPLMIRRSELRWLTSISSSFKEFWSLQEELRHLSQNVEVNDFFQGYWDYCVENYLTLSNASQLTEDFDS